MFVHCHGLIGTSPNPDWYSIDTWNCEPWLKENKDILKIEKVFETGNSLLLNQSIFFILRKWKKSILTLNSTSEDPQYKRMYICVQEMNDLKSGDA